MLPFESEINSWIDPSGHIHPVPYGSTHHDWAKEQGLGGMKGAFAHGWGRVVPYGNDLMVHNDLMRPNAHQRAALRDIAIQNHMGSVVHGSEYEPLFWRTLWSNSDQFQRLGWAEFFARFGDPNRIDPEEAQAYSEGIAKVVRPNLAARFGGQIPPDVEPHLQNLESRIRSGEMMDKVQRSSGGDGDRARDVLAAMSVRDHPVYANYDPAAHGPFDDRFMRQLHFSAKHGTDRQMADTRMRELTGAPEEGKGAQLGESGQERTTGSQREQPIDQQVREILESKLFPQLTGNRQEIIGKAVGRSGSTVSRAIKKLVEMGDVDPSIRRQKTGQQILDLWRSGKSQQEILDMKGDDGQPLFKPGTVATTFMNARKSGMEAPEPMRQKSPQQHRDLIVEMAKQGMPPRDIAAKTGFPIKMVWATVLRGVPKEQRASAPKGLPASESTKKALDMIARGLGNAQIAAETGLSPGRVAQIRYRGKLKQPRPEQLQRSIAEQLQRSIAELVQYAHPMPGVPGGLGQAVAVARSRQALAVARAVSVALGRLGANPHKVSRAVLNTGGRSLPAAVASIYSPTTDANALAAAGWMGMMHHAPGVVAFRSLPGGPDRLHRISFNGPAGELINRLSAVGAYTHTLIPTKTGFTALVYDRGGKMTGPLMQSGLNFATAEGHGVTLNGQDELRAGTRAPEQPQQYQRPGQPARYEGEDLLSQMYRYLATDDHHLDNGNYAPISDAFREHGYDAFADALKDILDHGRSQHFSVQDRTSDDPMARKYVGMMQADPSGLVYPNEYSSGYVLPLEGKVGPVNVKFVRGDSRPKRGSGEPWQQVWTMQIHRPDEQYDHPDSRFALARVHLPEEHAQRVFAETTPMSLQAHRWPMFSNHHAQELQDRLDNQG